MINIVDLHRIIIKQYYSPPIKVPIQNRCLLFLFLIYILATHLQSLISKSYCSSSAFSSSISSNSRWLSDTALNMSSCVRCETIPSKPLTTCISASEFAGRFLDQLYWISLYSSDRLPGTFVTTLNTMLNNVCSPCWNLRSLLLARFFIGCNLNSNATPLLFPAVPKDRKSVA